MATVLVQEQIIPLTYQDYLITWKENFGEADTGQYRYYSGRTSTQSPVARLSESEFNIHLQQVQVMKGAFEQAYKAKDLVRVAEIEESRRPHLLALLML